MYQGHFSRKRFGQNFLNDQFVIENIVSAINPKKNQTIIEIGPGLAALTEPICERLDHLIVIELDRDLVTRLKTHPFLNHKLTIYQQDAMEMNFSKISEKIGQPLRLFGNLPYNISTSLILKLLNYVSGNTIADMHFMLQKEVADSLIAKPNSKAYTRLSVLTQYYCQITKILEVPPNAFIPIPKVSSTVVKLVPYMTPLPYSVKDLYILNFVISKAFEQRRKMIRNSLGRLFNKIILDQLTEIVEVDLTMRAENISIEKYCQIANYISDNALLTQKRELTK